MWQTRWFEASVPLSCSHTMQWGLSTFANSLFTELHWRCQPLKIQICFLLSDFRFTNRRKESVLLFWYVGTTECINWQAMTMKHASQVERASVKNKKLEMAGMRSKNFEGQQCHEDISGYRPLAGGVHVWRGPGGRTHDPSVYSFSLFIEIRVPRTFFTLRKQHKHSDR